MYGFVNCIKNERMNEDIKSESSVYIQYNYHVFPFYYSTGSGSKLKFVDRRGSRRQADLPRRIPNQSRQGARLHHSNLGRREGSVSSSEEKRQHPQVRIDLPLELCGEGQAEKQGAHQQVPGEQGGDCHAPRRVLGIYDQRVRVEASRTGGRETEVL